MANVVENYDNKELIEYLREKNLNFKEAHFELLRKEEITGSSFLEMTKEDFHSIGFAFGHATELAKFIAELKKCKCTGFCLHLQLL